MSTSGAGSRPPVVPITPDDHGGYVVLTIYTSFFVALLFWTTRITIRWLKAGLKWDDLFLLLAMLLALVQSICMQFDVYAGLGKRNSLDGQIHRRKFEELNYAALLLSILSQACSKISVNLLFHSLQPFPVFIKASYAVLAFNTAWAVAAFLAVAFQCQVPYPWLLESGRCVNLHNLAIGLNTVNIISEVGLIVLPIALMPSVQTTWHVRLLVISGFASRIFVVGVLIGHMVVSSRLQNYANAPWAYTVPSIWVQVVMNVSLITACVPGMQQILQDLRRGMTAITIGDDGNAESKSGSKTGYIFGTRSRLQTDCSRADNEGAGWEMSSMNRNREKKEEDIETESTRALTTRDIVVTREFSIRE